MVIYFQFDKFVFTCNMLTFPLCFICFGCDNHKKTFLQILINLARKFPEFEMAHCCNGHSVIHTILPVVGGSLFNGFGSNLCRDANSDLHAKLPSKRQATGDCERDTGSRDQMKRQKLQGQKINNCFLKRQRIMSLCLVKEIQGMCIFLCTRAISPPARQ